MTDMSEAAAPAAAIRILIADDHEVVRIGLAALLDAQADLTVVAQAGSGEEATRLARRHRPDVVVMDIRMPNGTGIESCRDITAELPETHVIMLTSHADSEALFDAIDAGASGYVLKRVGSGELVDAVRTVASGGSLLDPAVATRVLDRIRRAGRLEEAGAFAELTEQERRVLAHIADGASNREIATRMGLAEKTVRNYVSNVLAKLTLESRSQAAAYAIRNRLPSSARARHEACHPSESRRPGAPDDRLRPDAEPIAVDDGHPGRRHADAAADGQPTCQRGAHRDARAVASRSGCRPSRTIGP